MNEHPMSIELREKDAEIERLKALITELCAAMEKWEAAKHWGWTQELFQRAREATR